MHESVQNGSPFAFFSPALLYCSTLVASETAPGCFACSLPSWSSSPTAATNRAGAHRPRSTARQTRLSSRPVSRNTNHALPLCAACSSNAAGRHPAIVVACVHVRARRPGQFCSRARVLAATSPFFPRKKEREIHVRAATRERKARPHSHSHTHRHGRPAIGGPIGHQFRPGHGLSAEAGVHVPRAAPVIPGSGKSGRKIRSRWTAVVAFPLRFLILLTVSPLLFDWKTRPQVRDGCRSSNLAVAGLITPSLAAAMT